MKVQRYVSNDFTVRVAAVNATGLVAEFQALQDALPLATLGVGRSMVGALLMASNLKPQQEIGVFLKGNGPLGSLYAQASYEGHVRGYCPNPQYQAPVVEDVLDVGKALGHGHLTVSRQQPFQKQPFNGTVELVSGQVGDDIAHYLHQSQQIRSIVALGVFLDSYGKVKAAGGVLIEVMPGVEDEIVQKLQSNRDQFKGQISQMLFDGAKEIDLVVPYMQGIPFTQIPHEYEICYSCPCTSERVIGALSTLGVPELEEMIQLNEPSEIQCQMCGRNYKISVSELEQLKESLRKSSMH
jgi:molecular chaperone Hsp33